MTDELNRLADQLKRTLEGEAWHGPSVLELLNGVSAHQAAAHPIPRAHSIWELVLHLCGDYIVVMRRMAGDGRQITPEEDWPACPAVTEENWRESVDRLTRLNQELRLAVLRFPVDRLDHPLVPTLPTRRTRSSLGSRSTICIMLARSRCSSGR
jgi:hypothetical protein